MKTSQQLAAHFREVMLNGRWVSHTNFKDLLSQISWVQATQKIGDFNTIAALSYHVNYYIAGILDVFEGGTLEIRDKYSFDLPQINSEKEWDQFLEKMWTNAEAFATHVEQLPEDQWEKDFVDPKYGNYYRNIVGITEHGYYHLGQVSLLKKWLDSTQET